MSKTSLLVLGICLLASALLVAGEKDYKCFVADDDNGTAPTKLCFNTTSGQMFTMARTEAEMSQQELTITEVKADMDTMWIIVCGALVFFMQAGFGILEAGIVSEKNVVNILYKNVMDATIAAVFFWLLGYGIAYGDDNDGPFIGTANFALQQDTAGFHNWFFQWAFSAAAATIVAGSVAERCKLEAYFIYSIVLTVFVYPVVAHWIWDAQGWLNVGNPIFEGSNGMIDFAGCAVVHMVGGICGFVAAVVIGPRAGRFDPDSEAPKPHNVLLAALGVFFLWFGWYGFNCGSTLAVSGGTSIVAARVATTTTLAAAGGALSAAVYGRVFHKNYDLILVLNGVLAGLVSITSACAFVEPWAALVVGLIGGLLYRFGIWAMQKMKIDDPLDASTVHGLCGMWGALVPGIFATDEIVAQVLGLEVANTAIASGQQFLTQLIGVLSVLLWCLVTSAILFYGIKYTIGMRVSEDKERLGLDKAEHATSAYYRRSMRKSMQQVAGRLFGSQRLEDDHENHDETPPKDAKEVKLELGEVMA